VKTETFGQIDKQDVKKFTLSNSNGIRVEILELGATLAALSTPDRDGNLADITLGHETFEQWLENPHYFGATCGRVANRIANGKFILDGKRYQLKINNDPNGYPSSLHGGIKNFSRSLWQGSEFTRDTAEGVTLRLTSPSGDEGYPGELTTAITYTLTENNELVINMKSTADGATIVNLVNHSYWNLSGIAGSSIHNHTLQIPASLYLPSNPGMIPTGEQNSVDNTPFDFREPSSIGARIEDEHRCLKIGNGYDHCFVLEQDDDLTLGARLYDPKSGRTMEILTNQPGMHVYTGNFLDTDGEGKAGASYPMRSGVALESGNFPDAINKPEFPSPVLRPGEIYRHKIVHRFGIS